MFYCDVHSRKHGSSVCRQSRRVRVNLQTFASTASSRSVPFLPDYNTISNHIYRRCCFFTRYTSLLHVKLKMPVCVRNPFYPQACLHRIVTLRFKTLDNSHIALNPQHICQSINALSLLTRHTPVASIKDFSMQISSDRLPGTSTSLTVNSSMSPHAPAVLW